MSELVSVSAPVRILDVAKGVLIGLQRRDADHTFHQLVAVGDKHRVSTFELARALVATADGRGEWGGIAQRAIEAVDAEWGALLTAIQPSSGEENL